MTLLQYLTIMKRHGWVIVLTLLAALTGGVVVTKLMPVSYSASAMLRVQTAVEGGVGQYNSYNIFYADRLMRTYSHIVVSTPVLENVVSRLKLPSLPSVDVRIVADTELIQITVSDPDPNIAAQTVNTLGEVLIEHSLELYGNSISESEILHEQLTQMEDELSTAQTNYSHLLKDPTASPAQVTDAERLISAKQEIYETLLTQYQNARMEDVQRMNAVSIIERADVPSTPSKPNLVLNLVLTTLFGLVAGVGLALTAESLDSRLRSTEDMEHISGLPVLGQLPLVRSRKATLYKPASEQHAPFRRLWLHLSAAIISKNDQLTQIKGIGTVYSTRLYRAGIRTCRQIADMKPEELGRAAQMPPWSMKRTTEWIEQARALEAMNNDQTQRRHEPYVMLITSARSSEGKSTIAANLAAAAAYCDQSVLLIDADLWRPSLHNIVEQPNYSGLLELLREQIPIESAIQSTTIANLDILTSGGILQNGELFAGFDKLRMQVLEHLHDYDVIIIDGPPQLEVADALTLARLVESVLLVVAYGVTRRDDLTTSVHQLYQANVQPVGLIVNRVPQRYSSYYYTPYKGASSSKHDFMAKES